MQRAYYSDSIVTFLNTSPNEILGTLVRNSGFPVEQTESDAWLQEIDILKKVLSQLDGKIYFEYAIPRMGKRIDVILLIGPVIFVLEFKIGERQFTSYAIDQVWDYALDLKNFHESSYEHLIAPVLIATKATPKTAFVATSPSIDRVLSPIRSSIELLEEVIERVLNFAEGGTIDSIQWEQGRYRPTPTIIEAAMALYNGHAVADISRRDAAAINLTLTSNTISDIIRSSKEGLYKSICFVTGVPGAGKTLVGLKIATEHNDQSNELYSVYLSGNGPLVAILREALTRDKVQNEKKQGRKIKKGEAMRAVSEFIQNVHHFRDEYNYG
jgi:hypothetical protein